jgi:hypothetical protein
MTLGGENMSKQDRLAVWLTDPWARLFLGLSPAAQPSRWVLVGERKTSTMEMEPVGFWFAVDFAEERRPGGERVRYRVTPPRCVLNWSGIITIQELQKGEPGEIGIQVKEVAS